MTIERYPWLNDALKAHENISFSSSLIIEGELGLAKRKLANYFAQKLLCSEALSPCGECNSCNYFLAGSHPDFCFLDHDSCSSVLHSYSKAKKDDLTSKKIEGIRALNEFMGMTNSVSVQRVAVIFEAHLMNINSQNALLKTLEELPTNKHIFIISNQRKYFLPTIYSRSNLISINNPDQITLNQWILDQGYIDSSVLNFAPDSTPLEIERLINNEIADQYVSITQKLNSYCLGSITTPDLIKFYKDTNMSFAAKINSIILFLKTCIGVNLDFYKSHALITSIEGIKFDTVAVSDLIEELVDYKYMLNKVPALNEQIGLNYFFYKIRKIFL